MTDFAFSDKDRAQLAGRGISLDEAQRQLQLLRHPPPPIVLDRPCVIGDGVVAVSPAEHARALARGRAVVSAGRVTKFVPASGAATRMFQALIAARSGVERPSSTPAGRQFFDHLDAFPFSRELRDKSGVSGPPATDADERRLLATLLETMGYADMPKGLIPFHLVDRPHTAFEDQVDEGVGYTRGHDGVCRMHFTVTKEGRAAFEQLLTSLRAPIESRGRCTLQVGFSEQHPSTDTIAIDEQGEPFRLASGDLLFRPAGHGALIDNLQSLEGDIVVIKNIDNILPPRATAEVVRWKLVLIGLLDELQEKVFSTLATYRAGTVGEAGLDAVIADIGACFGRTPAGRLIGAEDKCRFVVDTLDRPLRVCGVVRNDGEPGGAPFWVVDAGGGESLQIVESAQVDAHDAAQAQVFRASTHFNPVDIVCAVRRSSGAPFTLAAFVDPDAAFLSDKSYEGRRLTALERPGLWNGAMAHWNTMCVEVPASTFAPVKTVFDLLRPQHR